MRMLLLLCALGALSGCGMAGGGAGRYVVGAPYQVGGLWRYPAEDFSLNDTGIAGVVSKGGATTNGESFDAANLAASHRTLQLPAIARLTNLENGRQVVVRVNDRGPADPARLVGVTRQVATLLGAANPSAFRVRLQVLEDQSRQLAQEAQGQAPGQAPGQAAAPAPVRVEAAPRGGVQAESLAPPGGASAGRGRVGAAPMTVAQAAPVVSAAIPLRLPPQVTQGSARPGVLAIECGAFGSTDAAGMMRARLAPHGAQMRADYNAPRDRAVVVRIAPLPSLPAAEARLRQVLGAGCPDGRIIVE